MSLRPRAFAAPAVAVALLLWPATVFAQESLSPPVPLIELSMGYAFLHDAHIHQGFPWGWYASAAVPLTRWFGFVGEVTGSYGEQDFTSQDGRFAITLATHAVLGGPRFFRKVGRVVPFGQVLAGAGLSRDETTFPSGLGGGTYSYTTTEIAIQPGAGVTIYLGDRAGLRVAGDYRCLMDFDEDGNSYKNSFRFTTGLTLHLGTR